MRLEGDIVTPQGVITGYLDIADGRVATVAGSPVDAARAGEGGRPLLLPGFIDTHVHGGGGRDTMEGGDAIAAIARRHARHGTTALLATTMTAPVGEIEAALKALGPVCRERGPQAARVLGVHLEGPYINPGRLGAQPAHAIPALLDDVLRLNAIAPIKVLTLAPEVPGHLALIGPLRDAGIRVQIGHSNGSYDDGLAALKAGAAGFTHLFNAMSGLHHREPGMVGAALAHARHAELIPDLLHVHPGAIRAALRCIPDLFCVTDSTAAAGMPDGDYRLGEHTVRKCMGGVRLADGTLAGSALTMDQALRNLVQALGLPLPEASRRVSTAAADYLGLTDRGRLIEGAWADVVVMDAGLELRRVFVEGEEIDVIVDA
ncbi:N-acetylglucosamine-6-phosphate deacetylase [Roseateles sp.]|uniref:N-acetylglucosamine-6-phosphate deacetylase n=1 Tax=Roseateles sp. TaxID=1971397 RepID=UPI0039E9688A